MDKIMNKIKQKKALVGIIIASLIFMGFFTGVFFMYQYSGGYTTSEMQLKNQINTIGFANDNFITEETVDISANYMAEYNIEDKNTTVNQSEKLVYKSNIIMQTLNFDETVKEVKSTINKYNGFIETESTYDNDNSWYYYDYKKTSGTRETNIVIRIPSNDYNNFLNDINGVSKIISSSSSVENITKQYNNTSIYIEQLKIQQNNLLQMLENATTISDMLEIESRLSEIEYELRIANNDLSEMDLDVDYSTITLTIEEVYQYVDARNDSNFINRFLNNIDDSIDMYKDFFENLLFLTIRFSPIIIIITIIVIIKKKRKK